MEKTNVFSEHAESISILVYTQSFFCDPESFDYFKNANLLNSIHVYFMPLLGTPDKVPPVKTGIYKHVPEENAICSYAVFSDCTGRAYLSSNTPQRKTDEELSIIAEEVMLRHPFHPLTFDYTVASDSWCEEHKDYSNVTPYSEAKDILRLFLVNKKEFEVIDHYYIDEFFYYTYRHKVLFPKYQAFWSSTLESKNELDTNTASALGNRLTLLSMCLDNARIEAYKIQNNTTAMHLKYHISYLLLLITGVFDSLAWIINNLYTLGFGGKKRRQIDVINPDFRKEVEIKSAAISSLLSDADYINKVEAIRELRDRIVHRNFIDTISSGDRANRQNYLWIDQVASDKLRKAGFEEKAYFIRNGDLNAVVILELLDFLQDTVVNIVNCFLNQISSEIYHSSTNDSVSKLLNLPSDPYVL